MKLKDYLRHYLYGNIYEVGVSICQLIGIGDCYYTIKTKQGNLLTLSDRADIKLALRRLEDMTEEHKSQIGKALGQPEEMVDFLLIKADRNCDHRLGPSAYFKITPHLTRLGYDLFGLIDAGLAIDLKTLTP